jgi:hypothetical protein
MMQQALCVVEAEEKRAHDLRLRAATKAADDTIRAAEVLDLLHPVTLAGSVVEVAPLGDNAVKRSACLRQPFFRLGQLIGHR